MDSVPLAPFVLTLNTGHFWNQGTRWVVAEGLRVQGALACCSVLRTSGTVPPLRVCPGPPNNGVGEGKKWELVVLSPHSCHTSLTGPSLSPSAFSVFGLALGPYPSLWSLVEVSLPC